MIPIDANNPHGELRSISADRGALMNNLNNQSNSSTGKFFLFPFRFQIIIFGVCVVLYFFGIRILL